MVLGSTFPKDGEGVVFCRKRGRGGGLCCLETDSEVPSSKKDGVPSPNSENEGYSLPRPFTLPKVQGHGNSPPTESRDRTGQKQDSKWPSSTTSLHLRKIHTPEDPTESTFRKRVSRKFLSNVTIDRQYRRVRGRSQDGLHVLTHQDRKSLLEQ